MEDNVCHMSQPGDVSHSDSTLTNTGLDTTSTVHLKERKLRRDLNVAVCEILQMPPDVQNCHTNDHANEILGNMKTSILTYDEQ